MEMTRDIQKTIDALAAGKKVRYGDGFEGVKVTAIIPGDKPQVSTWRRGRVKDGKSEVTETVDIDPEAIFTIY